jgi:hypothetical protein
MKYTRKELDTACNNLSKKYPDKEFGQINITRKSSYEEAKNTGEYWDSTQGRYIDSGIPRMYENFKDDGWELFLGHSCDEWVIGTLSDAESFNTDLSEAIEYCKNNP